MINQRQIKNYLVDTIAALKLLTGRQDELCYCKENESRYRFEASGAAYTANDTTIIITAAGGDTRWLAVAGKYLYSPTSTSEITKEPTGFTAPENVIVTGDGTARTVTLTGTVNAYYHSIPNETIVSGWTSPAHDNTTTKVWFLTYDGTDIDWRDISVAGFDYSNILIAFAFYNATDGNWVYQRECHGLQQWQSHKIDHDTIGTYRDSGGTLADYTLASTTAAERRPSVSTSVIYDEDLPTTNLALPVGTYTQYYIDGAGGSPNFITTATDIVPLSTNRPYWNEFTGGAWQQTLMSTGDYMNIWIIAVPTAADANSQKLRYLFVQGQQEFGTATGASAETTNDVNLGEFSDLTPELVYISKVTIRYIWGNWQLIEVTDLTGTKLSQSQSPTGNYLSSVASDTTLTGIGTTGDPLGLNLTNANSWTGVQTFEEDVIVSGDLTVNGTTTTIDATTLIVEDKNIEMGNVTTPTDITADGGGITLLGDTNKTIIWDNANDNWTANQSLNVASGLDYKVNDVSVLNATTLGSSVLASSLTSVGTLEDLTVTNAITGSVNGNAGTVSTITGLAPDTATTQAAQPNITSVGTLESLAVTGNITTSNLTKALTTTATAAGTTTLTADSAGIQEFTGTADQICKLPVTSTLTTGFAFKAINNSTGIVTYNSSGGNEVVVLQANTRAKIICIGTTLTTAADWTISVFANQENPLLNGEVTGTAVSTTGGNSKLVKTDSSGNAALTGGLTAGGDSTINGIKVGRGAGNIATNTASGYQALYSNTTGASNTANGHIALSSNTTGNSNTASGLRSLSSNETGSYNTASGYAALYSNETGASNTANGYAALYLNTTGVSNIASGNSALFSNTTGSYNIASGNTAGRYAGSASASNETSSYSVYVGSDSRS